MDEKKHFFGEHIANGVSQLILGWSGDRRLMERELEDDYRYRGGRHEYYDQHALFRERLHDGGFQIPDMVEVELPAGFLRDRLRNNGSGRLYYYLEAFGFWTEGMIDYQSCSGLYSEMVDECILVINDRNELEYVASWETNVVLPVVTEPVRVAEPEPEPEIEVEPEMDPGIEAESEPQPEIMPEPEPEIEPVEPEPEPEVEPEEESKPEPELEVPLSLEPEPESEPEIIELAAAPEVREVEIKESAPLVE